MRRNNIRKLTTILTGTFMCITLFACKNFLNAGTISEEIKDTIAYNNAKTVNIALECKQEMGSIFPAPTFSAKVGYAFEIQLLINEDYFAVKDPSKMLEAVSRIDDKVSRNNCVEFEVQTQSIEDKKVGLYRIKTKIIKYADDILIRPVCYELPLITGHSPDSLERTAYANEPIILTFNIPMEAADASAETTAATFNYNNIYITYNGESVSNLFNPPVLNSEKTKLTMAPKPLELQEFIKKENLKTILFDVYVTQNIKATIDEVSVPLISNSHNNFSVSYNTDFETTPPSKRELFITNTPIEIETAGTVKDNEKFSEVALAEKGNYTDEQYKNLVYQNTTTRGEFYIYGRFFDADSEVETVNVYFEKRYKQDPNTGEDMIVELSPEEVEQSSMSYTVDSPEVSFITHEAETIFCIKHTSRRSGEYSLTVTDICGNESGKTTFSVFSVYIYDLLPTDNIVDVDGVPKQVLHQQCKQRTPETWSEFNETEFYKQLKHLTYTVENVSIWNSIAYPLDKLSVLCEYNGKTQAFTPTKNPNSISWNITLDVASVSGLPITLIIKDTFGLNESYDYYFPDKNENFIATITDYGDWYNYKFYGQSTGYTDYWYMVRTNKTTGTKEYRFIHNDELDSNYTYSFLYDSRYAGGKLLGEMPEGFYFDNNASSGEAPDPISITDNQVSLEKASTEGMVKVTVTFTPEQLAYYDLIFINQNTESNNPGKVMYNNPVPKNTGICTFEIAPKYLYGNYIPCKIYINAIKNGKITNSSDSIYIIPYLTDSDDLYETLDDVPPIIDFYHTKYSEDSVTFILKDYESGAKSGTIYLNKNPNDPHNFTLDANREYTCTIPFCDLFPYSTYEQIISYTLEDNAKNTISGTEHLDSPLVYKEYYEFLKREEDYLYLKEYRHIITNYSAFYAVPFSNGFATTYNNYCSATFSIIDNDTRAAKIYTFSIPGNSTTGTFVKIVNNEEGLGHPFYYFNYYDEDNDSYTLGTGLYNGIYKIGTSKSAIGVCSDAPVYVHTLVTKVPYEICKDWDHLEWEYNKKSLNEEVLEFTTPVQQRYTIPVDSMDPGDCYVVIAHYANNAIDVSEVMQK